MSINIQPRVTQYRSLAPLIKPEPVKSNQLPSICSVFPEFFKQRAPQTIPQKPVFQHVIANTANYNSHISISASTSSSSSTSACPHSVNYSMPFLYSMQGRLRTRVQSKSYFPRRKRVTTYQLQILNEEFKRNPLPSIEKRSQLSERLNISARSIQIWFQNKRQTARGISYE